MMLDDTLQLLSKEPRRKMMYVMEDAEENVFAYEDVTEKIIGQYQLREEKKIFKTKMMHAHLPKMEESGLIEHDQRSETVCYIQDEEVEELLKIIEKYED